MTTPPRTPGITGLDEQSQFGISADELRAMQVKMVAGVIGPYEALAQLARNPFDKELDRWVTTDPAMLAVKEQVRALRFKECRKPVLITGPTGTGKELLARALTTPGQPFIPYNCAAIPDKLTESIFFGHVKGAFTDAKESRKGVLEEAGSGVVFLDEIGELELPLQAKFLRAIQEGEVLPVGSIRPVKIDCQFVAATKYDLKQRVKDGMFRDDLFERLRTFELKITGLAARPGDIQPIAAAYNWLAKIPDFMTSEIYEGNVRAIQRYIDRMSVYGYYDLAHKMLLEKAEAASVVIPATEAPCETLHHSSNLIYES